MTVVVVLDDATLSRLAVVDRCLDSRPDYAHLGDDAVDSHELIDQVSLESARRDMIAPKVAIEIDIVDLGLLGELNVSSHGHFLRVATLTSSRIVLHALDREVELVLEGLDSSERVSQDESRKSRVELSKLVHVDGESVRLANNAPNLLLALLVVEEVLDHLLHLQAVSVARSAWSAALSHSVDLHV